MMQLKDSFRRPSMKIRAKFQVQEITQTTWGTVRVTLRPQYDPEMPEDERFAKATPDGLLEMDIENPKALEELKLGRVFYLDFVPVEG